MIDISTYTIVHRQADNHFEADLGEEKAKLIYRINAGLLVLLHTEVPPRFRRKGIAGMLATAALEYAKKEGLKVRSYCSYTTRFIENNPEYLELLG